LKVAEAANGLEGLRWLEDHPAPALILLDLMMPVMDGFGFLEAIERRPELHAIPVVVLTAKRLTPDEVELLTGRTERVMTKEATSGAELGTAIRKCLEGRGTRRGAAAIGQHEEPR
jgi:CheY-like chemotaxis protein